MMRGQGHPHPMGGGTRSEVLFGLLVLASLSFGGTMSVRDSAAGSPVSNIQQVRGPILIEGDANFTAANGVTSGTGLPGDPYIIAGWNISAAASNAISIRFTTASFEIRDTRVHSGGASYDGIVLEQVSDARINNVTADSNDDGIHVTRSNGVTVAASTFEANRGSGLTVLNTLSPRVENDSVTGRLARRDLPGQRRGRDGREQPRLCRLVRTLDFRVPAGDHLVE